MLGVSLMSTAIVFLQVAIFVGFIVAAILLRRLYVRYGLVSDAYLSAGLVVAAFSQLHFALDPVVASGIVTSTDALRLVFYAILVMGIQAEIGGDFAALRRANAELNRLREVDAANATLAERTRLAREIHDGLAQDLWYAKLKQGRLTQNESLDAEAKTTAGEVLNAIDSALAEARQAVMAMRVDPSAASSLEEVLRSYVEDFADRFGVRAEFEAEGTLQRLPPRTEAEVLRIVQEALNNVRRHADATRRPGPDGADRTDLAHLGHRQWTRVRPVGRAAGELRPARDARTRRARRRDAGHPVAPPGRDADHRRSHDRGGTTRVRPILRVMLVDDHGFVRSAIRQALTAPDVEVVGEAPTAEEALRIAPELRPDVMLIDIDLPGMNGLRLLRELRPRLPDSKFVMLTVSTSQADVLEAVRLGAVGYLTKDLDSDALLRAIRGVRDGDLAMPRKLAARTMRDLVDNVGGRVMERGTPGLDSLSPREEEILRLLADGMTDREIGEAPDDLDPDRRDPRQQHPAQARLAKPGRGRAPLPGAPLTDRGEER